jgi:hypothetical protein
MAVTKKTGLDNKNALITQSLGGPGPIAYDEDLYTSLNTKRNEIIDYIKLRLGDGMVDVELDKEHYDLSIKTALLKYRQKSSNSVEESYAFLNLLPETQEYILPNEIMQVRQIYRRGIGSVTGTTASQFEPFASGYLNTYMLVAGRVGGLVNYELFTQYQEMAMRFFGGFINYTFNNVTKKLTIVRKMPASGKNVFRINSLTANATTVGSTITIVVNNEFNISQGDIVVINNCPVAGYNGNYTAQTVNISTKTVTVTSVTTLGGLSVTGFDASKTEVTSPVTDSPAESVLLHIYNYKPDSMILNDYMIFPWIQEYAYSFAKRILGEARSKFAQLAGPGGGTQLNGTALIAEAKEEMDKLEEDLKRYVDGAMPLTWVIG